MKRQFCIAAILVFTTACGDTSKTCQAPTAPTTAAPRVTTTTSNEEPKPHAPAAELQSRLLSERDHQTLIKATSDGMVTAVQTTTCGRKSFAIGTTTDEYVRDWFAAYGPLLGAGNLGAPRFVSEPNAPRVGVVFDRAEACPGLTAEYLFMREHERCPGDAGGDCTFAMPVLLTLECPSRPAEPEIKSADRADPLANKLAVDGFKLPHVSRHMRGLSVQLPEDSRVRPRSYIHPGQSRSTWAKDWVTRYAPLFDMGAIGALDVLEDNERVVSLAWKDPPLDSTCITFQARFELTRDPLEDPRAASSWPKQVTISCPRESSDPGRPSADGQRALPSTATGTLPYLFECSFTNYAWGFQHAGEVIDKKGDVWAFDVGGSGGSSDSEINGAGDANRLARKYRHARRFVRSLPPAEVDEYTKLVPRVAAAKLDQTPSGIVDGGASHCVAYKAEKDGRLGAIELGGSDMTRRGEDARRLMTWLDRARSKP